MNPEELRAYKREKSKKFNAHLRQLRLKDKENKKIADNQPDNQDDKQDDRLEDLLVKIETNHSSKIDELLNNVDGLLDTKLDELFNRLDTIESIIETKLETKISEETFKTKQPISRQPSIFFA